VRVTAQLNRKRYRYGSVEKLNVVQRFFRGVAQISLAGEVVFAASEEGRRDPRKAGEGGGQCLR
jgi:hypothetical protein